MHESTGLARFFSHPMSNSQTSFLLKPYDSLICDIKHSILATNQKSVPTHKLQTQQRKIANQSFPMKTQGPDRRCGIQGLNQECSKHTHTHKAHECPSLSAFGETLAYRPDSWPKSLPVDPSIASAIPLEHCL